VHHRVSCTTVARCGLRLHEALSLQVSASDGPRHMLHVHPGTGAQDRSVPLPAETLSLLRTSWHTHRHPPWLFPATGRDHQPTATAPEPMSRRSVQGACRTATQRAGIITRDGGVQTLRHAAATPRLAAGVTRRAMQRSLGHAQRDTTMRSLHLTPTGHDEAAQRLDALRRGCQA
jgi:integrase